MNVEERIASYLGNGGLFNPECMDHEKVRDLIMDCLAEVIARRLEKTLTINKIGEEAHQTNINNGWDVFHPSDWPAEGEKAKVHFLCTHMALFHAEVSEATEAIRHRDGVNFAEELADIIIRVASVAYGLGIDLDTVTADKMEKNKTRGLHHGGKAV